jgi:hypothetical protein
MNTLKIKLKMKKLLIDAGRKDYWENEKFVNSLIKNKDTVVDLFFSKKTDGLYNFMNHLGCFK